MRESVAGVSGAVADTEAGKVYVGEEALVGEFGATTTPPDPVAALAICVWDSLVGERSVRGAVKMVLRARGEKGC